MGDVDGGAKATAGHADGVGYTGLNDINEIFYIAKAGEDPSLLYSHSMSGFSVNASADNPSKERDSYAVGASYKFADMLTVAVGAERAKKVKISKVAGTEIDLPLSVEGQQFVFGAVGEFGPVTAKGVVSDGELDDKVGMRQFAASIAFSATEQLSMKGFFRNSEFEDATIDDLKIRGFGLGASYALGGGASIVAGVTNLDLKTDSKSLDGDSTNFDLGLSFEF